MAYVLEDILSVRRLRENKALNAMVQRKADLERAITCKAQKEQALSDYRQWRLEEEQRMFTDLQQQAGNIHDILLFVDTTNGLREGQADRAKQVVEAGEQITAAQKELDAARQGYAQAHRKKAKIEEHKTIWMEAYQQEQEAAAEIEMEDVVQASTGK